MTFSNLFCSFSDMDYEDHFTVAILGGTENYKEFDNYHSIPYDLLHRTVVTFSSWERGVPGHWLVALR